LTCILCSNQTVCSSCTLNGTNMAYLLGLLCYNTCPSGFYGDNNYLQGPNTCLSCDPACLTCTNNPTPCQSCKNGSYLYNSTCLSTCPNGTIAYSMTNQCMDCTSFCVDLNINIYFPSSYSEFVYVDMKFTKPLDFNSFNVSTFQTIAIADTNPS
jgi:hypothetical protein